MSNRFRLVRVENAELLAGLSQLVQGGNELTGDLLAHLAELEERRLHLQLGFPSLFAYCVEALGLSEGSAGRRVAAARVCRRFPEAFELVARGDLHLSALCGLAPHLNLQNATELFAACCRKTRRQVDELLAVRFPKPDVREQIRRLPVRGRAPAVANDPRIPDCTESQDEALAKASVAGQGHDAALLETVESGEDCSSETAGASVVESPPPTAPPRRCELEALSADRRPRVALEMSGLLSPIADDQWMLSHAGWYLWRNFGPELRFATSYRFSRAIADREPDGARTPLSQNWGSRATRA
jgi:hypothetical protein